MTDIALRDAIRTGTTAKVTAWRDEMVARDLMAKKPAAGTVRARREIPEIGVTVLTLSNGVDVWLKPTDFRNDQISFASFAPGGVSLAAPDNFNNASLASSLVGLSGVGGITPVELGKLLAGKVAGATSSIGTYSQSVSGSASPKDLETALQLAHLRFTAPNKDASAFELMKRQLRDVAGQPGVRARRSPTASACRRSTPPTTSRRRASRSRTWTRSTQRR